MKNDQYNIIIMIPNNYSNTHNNYYRIRSYYKFNNILDVIFKVERHKLNKKNRSTHLNQTLRI